MALPAMSSRTVLWAGFGSLLALMIAGAIAVSHALGRIESTNSEIRQGFLRRDDLLDRLRGELYRSNIDLRDYLMHADPQLAETRRAELQRSQQDILAILHDLRRDVPTEEAAAIDELHRDVDAYFALAAPVLQWDAATRTAQGPGYLRQQIFPKRQQMLALSERIRDIDARQLALGQTTVAGVFSSFRRALLVIALAVTLLGAALALFAIRRVEALEREASIRYREAARAREELHRLSARLVALQEEERRKLSRELHDEIGQSMSALLVELGSLASAMPPDAGLQQRMQAVRALAENNVVVLRNLSLLLRPSMLDDLGLVPALKWQAREVSRRSGIKVRVDAEDAADDLPDEYRTCIYRVVQEALHNVTKHSQATQVRVSVRRETSRVAVTIKDDGAGFASTREKGLGILGMEERVHSLKGKFHMQSAPGRGTSIEIELPLEPAAAPPSPAPATV